MNKKIAISAAVVLCGLWVWSVWSQQAVRVNMTAYAVAAPNLVAVTTTPTLALGTNLTTDTGKVLMRTIQNLGTTAVLYTINSTNVSASSLHGVIAAGNTAQDGQGSVLDLARVPFPVWVATASGTSQVAIVELTQ